MSLRIYETLEQGSSEWLEARRGLLTASQVGKMLTPRLEVANNETSRALTATLVAERLTGRVDYVHPSWDMQRGTLDEPYARALYAEQYDERVQEVGFVTNTFNGYTLGASPDGLCGTEGGIEIKSRRPKEQLRTILTDEVPAENMAQIQASMLVTDRFWWDYVSYAGGWPLYVRRVFRDIRWGDAIKAALEQFELTAGEMVDHYKLRVGSAPVAPLIDHFPDVELKL